MKLNTIYLGKSEEILQEFEENSIDAVVTDPPYGLSKEPDIHKVLDRWLVDMEYQHNNPGFMGKTWDSFVPSPLLWKEVYRVMKPGGYLLSFGGTRTYDLMVLSLRLAGFEIRDMINWVYQNGFPKSRNIGKDVDEIQGNERKVVGRYEEGDRKNASVLNDSQSGFSSGDITKGNSEWEGWGTALKPAQEPIVLARKPIVENTIAENVLERGTGAINIDESRIKTDDNLKKQKAKGSNGGSAYGNYNLDAVYTPSEQGRFPANLIFDEYTGEILASQGGSPRFFYCPKASKSERNRGLSQFQSKKSRSFMNSHNGHGERVDGASTPEYKNFHPTTKPVDLMKYLIKLITPPYGVVLDPFLGSGTTAVAAQELKFNWIGIEMEKEYVDIAKARVKYVQEDQKFDLI